MKDQWSRIDMQEHELHRGEKVSCIDNLTIRLQERKPQLLWLCSESLPEVLFCKVRYQFALCCWNLALVL